MKAPKVTSAELRKALAEGRVVVTYPRLKKIALDGFPARPATAKALSLTKNHRPAG